MASRRKSPARTDENPPEGPVRTCIGCRQRAAKRELLRVTAGSDQTTGQPVVRPDPEGTAPGRGAHLHPTTECYELAVRRKAFGRALRLDTGPSAAPVGDYLASRDQVIDRDRPTRNWSNSS